MSDTELKRVVEPGDDERRRRGRKPSESEDTEALLQLYRSRSGYAGLVTRKLNAFSKAFNDTGTSRFDLQYHLDDLTHAMNSLETAHERYVLLARCVDSSKIDDCDRHLAETAHHVREACQLYEKAVGKERCFWPTDDVKPEDSVSQAGSNSGSKVSSTSSARAKASAKRAALEEKRRGMEKWQELENKRRQMEMEIERMKLETEINAANAEEEMLRTFELDDANKQNESFHHLDTTPTAMMPEANPRSSGWQPRSVKHEAFYETPRHEATAARGATWNDANSRESGWQQALMNHDGFHGEPAHRAGPPPNAASWSPWRHQVAPGIQVAEVDLHRQLIETMSLPKTSMVKFDGNPLQFSIFVQSFESCVGRTTVDDGTKLNLLFEGCTGKAARVIEPCALMNPTDGLRRAKQMLSERFGNPYRISEAWIKKVTEGPPVKTNNGDSLQEFADDVRSCAETLNAMNMMGEIDSRIRMVKIVERLPGYLQGRWRKIAIGIFDETGSYPNVDRLVQFLDRVARESNDPVFGYISDKSQEKQKGSSTHITQSRSKGSSFNAQASNTTDEDTSPSKSTVKHDCFLCKGQHKIRDCDKFLKMSGEERLATAKEKRLCFNCLSGVNHRAGQCKVQNSCGTDGCVGKHSKLLHGALVTDKPKESDNEEPKPTRKPAESMACSSGPSEAAGIALPIVPVLVKGEGQNFSVATHALLDPGSNRTFCAKELVDKLNLKGVQTNINLETLSNGTEVQATEVSFEVTGMGNKRRALRLNNVLAVDKFPKFRGIGQFDVGRWDHLKDIDMPEDREVHLLIGQDHPQALRPLEVKCGGDHEPYAVRTSLGWTMNGPVGGLAESTETMATISTFVQASADLRLESQVERFWKVESCGEQGKDLEMSIEDKEVLNLWNQSTRLVDGHYELPIPFRKSSRELPDNRRMAEKRLVSLGRRLTKDPQMMEKYTEGMKDLMEKGYAEPVEVNAVDSDVTWYLPHHNVVNPNKPDKVRIVFDCAAEFRGVSLNKVVLPGPDMTNRLLGVLLRFREHNVAIMGDVEAMYHQVKVVPEHRDALRFLWWPNGDVSKEPNVYRMTSHLFGGVWSPSCATYALRRVAKDNCEDFTPEVRTAVEENFYVDDCLVSATDVASASKLLSELQSMLSKGGFRLTKWSSNRREVIRDVPECDRAKPLKGLDLEHGTVLPGDRALGVHWDAEEDMLGIQVKLRDPISTRRGLLSLMSSTFDPLGLVCPFVLIAKKIFQEECRRGKGWDEPLSEENAKKWLQWMEDLPVLENFRVKRCITPGDAIRREVHLFSDASQEAYGSVSYLRSVKADGKVDCALLLGKSRLAPISTVTVPRLELMAAVTAVQMATLIQSELRLPIDRMIFWTDSMIVLHYIRNRNKRFKTFVANRISAIHEGSSPNQWRHVGTEVNPADDASRGLNAQDLVSSDRWSEGPEFLKRDESHWPKQPEEGTPDMLNCDAEIKPEVKSCAVVAEENEEGQLSSLLHRYSSWYKLQKAVAWLVRFKMYCQSRYLKKQPEAKIRELRGPITIDEMKSASKDVIKYVQKTVFSKEVSKGIPGRLSKLNPILEDGIMKVGGRIDRAPVSYEARHPPILPNKHHVTDLIIRHYHQSCRHVGATQVLAAVRQLFWIVKGRAAVRRVLSRCVLCRKRNHPKALQQMAPLPEDRLTPDKPPFTCIGIDYFGPFYVKQGRSTVKRYGCLFTCLSTRAVHIEISHSLELDSFLCALQRFTSRRGRPAVIYSDNGTNFHGGNRELQQSITEWNRQKLESRLLQDEIEWHFNPPSASHMGGVWERLIRSTRHILASMMKEQVVSDETLTTFMAEVERIINDRPLTDVSEDAGDPEPLSPSKLLLLRSNESLPPGVFNPADRYNKRWWRQSQYLADVFWRRWVREYLPSLQERQKWHHPKRNFEKNDIVLVADENLPRGQWPLGRVLDTYPGSKGHVRSVKVQFGGSAKDRPIHKLVFLEG